jgi:predicted ester cyclase
LNKHQFERAGEFYAESFLLNGAQRDAPSFRAQIADLIATFPDRDWAGRARGRGGGTHQGAYDGIQPTGRKFRTSELARYRLADGRVVESWYLFDEADLKRQLTRP